MIEMLQIQIKTIEIIKMIRIMIIQKNKFLIKITQQIKKKILKEKKRIRWRELVRKEKMKGRRMKKTIKNMKNREILKGHQKGITEEKMRGTTIEESVLIEALIREIKSIGRVIARIDNTNTIGIKEIDITLDQKIEMMIIIREKKSQENLVIKVEAMESKKLQKKNSKEDKILKQRN